MVRIVDLPVFAVILIPSMFYNQSDNLELSSGLDQHWVLMMRISLQYQVVVISFDQPLAGLWFVCFTIFTLLPCLGTGLGLYFFQNVK